MQCLWWRFAICYTNKLLFTSLLSFTFCWNSLVERWFSVCSDWYWIYWSRFSNSFPARTEKIMINLMLKDEPRKWLTGCAFVQSGWSQVDKAACRQHDRGALPRATSWKLMGGCHWWKCRYCTNHALSPSPVPVFILTCEWAATRATFFENSEILMIWPEIWPCVTVLKVI